MESYSQLVTMSPNLPSSSGSTHNSTKNHYTPTANVTEPLLPSQSSDSGGSGKSRCAEMDSTPTGDCGSARVDNTSCDRTKQALAVSKVGKKIKKQKFAFQTRSAVDILDDGFRWRKYGQKAVKNSKFPRSYYKCAYEGCNVKKQVQRLSKDEGVVVTTYEGIHTHSDSDTDNCTDNFEEILTQMQI